MKIVVAGGGTGGHYYPAVAVLRKLREEVKDLKILYFTTKGRIEEKMLKIDLPEAKSISLKTKGLFRPLFYYKNIFRLIRVLLDTLVALKYIRKFKAEIGFLTGGYITVPVGLALRLANIPFVIHEQNLLMGVANKFLSKYANKVLISYSETKGISSRYKDRVVVTGNPVRVPADEIDRCEQLRKIGIFECRKPFVIVLGGSLGSETLDNFMELVYNLKPEVNFFHITKNPTKFIKYPFVKAKEYETNLYDFLAIADGIVARAGATTVAEVIFYNLKGILIPWEGSSESHQLENAYYASKVGKIDVIREKDFEPKKAKSILEGLKIKCERWRKLKDESTERVKEILLELYQGGKRL